MALQYAFPLFSVISGFLWKLFTLSLKELGSTQGYICEWLGLGLLDRGCVCSDCPACSARSIRSTCQACLACLACVARQICSICRTCPGCLGFLAYLFFIDLLSLAQPAVFNRLAWLPYYAQAAAGSRGRQASVVMGDARSEDTGQEEMGQCMHVGGPMNTAKKMLVSGGEKDGGECSRAFGGVLLSSIPRTMHPSHSRGKWS